MPPLASHLAKVLYLSLTVLLLSSCGSMSPTALYPLPESDLAAPATDPELLLVESETEQSLTEELEALRRAGNWQLQAGTTEQKQNRSTTYDFPIVINKQVETYLDIFQHQQKKAFGRWLARSGRYVPMFQRELRDAGLPEDLAYLAMIESGFNQRAYSRAKAVGLWQFMKATGKSYNLKIDKYVDERRHAEKSTKAAVAYLSDLYAEFGDWHLAVAGYNAGQGKIGRGLKRYQCNNFWSLAQHPYLRLETKRYVPKLIAAILIAKNPEKYGFSNIQYEAPLQYETLKVSPGLSLEAVALISKSDAKTIKQLNQELKIGRTPLNRRHYSVQIPVGTREIAKANLPRLNKVASTGYKTHVIRKGDTISKICRRYNINKTTLLKVNNLRSSKLVAGKHLRIPHSSVRYRLLGAGEQGKLAANDLILHKIKPGETIGKIARTYHVPASLIVDWNGLKSVHKIRAGQQLALYIEESDMAVAATSVNRSRPNKTSASMGKESAIIILAEQKKIVVDGEGSGNDSLAKPEKTQVATRVAPVSPKNSSSVIVLAEQKKIAVAKLGSATKKVSWYLVQSGDSLWTISRKFNLSTKQLKSWNNLKSNRLQPGVKLKIKNV
ncbi:MAG: LysM peptidoglycan-binding domain-containing protein [Thermodesulfobacteriota bacterium]